MLYYATHGTFLRPEVLNELNWYVNSIPEGRAQLSRAFLTWYKYNYLGLPLPVDKKLTPSDFGHSDIDAEIAAANGKNTSRFYTFSDEEERIFRRLKAAFDGVSLPSEIVLYRGEVVPERYIPKAGQWIEPHAGVTSTSLSEYMAKTFTVVDPTRDNNEPQFRVLKKIRIEGEVEGIFVPYYGSIYNRLSLNKQLPAVERQPEMPFFSPRIFVFESEVMLGPSARFYVESVTPGFDEHGEFFLVNMTVTDD